MVMTPRLSQALSSAARTDVLETLFHQAGELGLRQVALISGLPVRSVEVALAGLVRERCVHRRRSGERVYFALNRGHATYPLLADVFRAAERWRIRRAAAARAQAGRETMAFAEAALPLLERARRSRRVAG